MKILVIHLFDHTTNFLSCIYADWDCTVIRSKTTTKKAIRYAIHAHDLIVMLGHGDEKGLLRDYHTRPSYLIDSQFVFLLRQKQCVCVWCNADVFVKKYDLHGFTTGMIISEADEALYCCIPFESTDIELSNRKFALALKVAFDYKLEDQKKIFHHLYSPSTPVEEFNNENIYIF